MRAFAACSLLCCFQFLHQSGLNRWVLRKVEDGVEYGCCRAFKCRQNERVELRHDLFTDKAASSTQAIQLGQLSNVLCGRQDAAA
jgi:hypothetical protein